MALDSIRGRETKEGPFYEEQPITYDLESNNVLNAQFRVMDIKKELLALGGNEHAEELLSRLNVIERTLNRSPEVASIVYKKYLPVLDEIETQIAVIKQLSNDEMQVEEGHIR